MGVKKDKIIITKNHAADPEIEFTIKLKSKPHGLASPCRQRKRSLLNFFFRVSSRNAQIFSQILPKVSKFRI